MAKGGGWSQTVTSGIAKEFLPELKYLLGEGIDNYKSYKERGMTPEQESALALKKSGALDQLHGRGIYDTRGLAQRDMQNVLGSKTGQASLGGYLGSARSDKAIQSALADHSAKWSDVRRRDVSTAGDNLLGLADRKEGEDNKQLSRVFGYMKNAPQDRITTGGGGK